MAKSNGAIIPDPINPPGTRRVVVCVPDSVEWLSLFTGCVAQMTFGWYWDKATGDFDAVRERAKQMYFEMQDQNGLCDMIDCSEVADCIENSDAVKAALEAFMSNTYNSQIAGSGGMPASDITANLLSQSGACDPDKAWGNALNIVQSLNRRNVDFLETVEALTNNQEALEYIISAIPVLETLPIDELVGIADKIRAWINDAYLAGYDLDYELERACQIFCLITASPTCELSYAQLRDFYWNKARAIAVFEDAFTSTVAIIEAWANWDETFGEIVCDVMCAFQFGFMNFLNSAFGMAFHQFKVQANSGIPDDDWMTVCDECLAPVVPVIGMVVNACMTGLPSGENMVYDAINGIWTCDGALDTFTDNVRITLTEETGQAFKFNSFTSNVGIGGSVWVLAADNVCYGGAGQFPPTDTPLLALIWAIQNTGTPLHVGFNFYS